jgi:hypothetical protein
MHLAIALLLNNQKRNKGQTYKKKGKKRGEKKKGKKKKGKGQKLQLRK